MKALPKTLFVKIEIGNGGNPDYFVADNEVANLVEMGETVRIGKYQLVEISDAKGVAEFKKRARR